MPAWRISPRDPLVGDEQATSQPRFGMDSGPIVGFMGVFVYFRDMFER